MNHQKRYHEVKHQKWCPSAGILEDPATYFRERPVGKGIPYAHNNFARCNELATPSCVRAVLGLAPTPQLSKGSWEDTCRIPRASAPGLTNQNVHNSLCERWHFVFLSFCLFVGHISGCADGQIWNLSRNLTKRQMVKMQILDKNTKCTSAHRETVGKRQIWNLSFVRKRQIWNLSRISLTNFKSVEHSSTNLLRIPRQKHKMHFCKRQLAKCKSAICVFVESKTLDKFERTRTYEL